MATGLAQNPRIPRSLDLSPTGKSMKSVETDSESSDLSPPFLPSKPYCLGICLTPPAVLNQEGLELTFIRPGDPGPLQGRARWVRHDLQPSRLQTGATWRPHSPLGFGRDTTWVTESSHLGSSEHSDSDCFNWRVRRWVWEFLYLSPQRATRGEDDVSRWASQDGN